MPKPDPESRGGKTARRIRLVATFPQASGHRGQGNTLQEKCDLNSAAKARVNLGQVEGSAPPSSGTKGSERGSRNQWKAGALKPSSLFLFEMLDSHQKFERPSLKAAWGVT